MPHKLKYLTYLSAVLSIISIALSVVAVCQTYYKYFSYNGLSLIIGILAIIVTILIGWQLALIIDLKNYDEKFNKLSTNLQNEILRVKGFSAIVYAHNNISWITPAKRVEWFIDYIRYSLEAIIYFSKIEDYKTCWAIINDLNTSIEGGDPEFYDGVKKHKDEWLLTLGDVSNKSQIENYSELIKLIAAF